MKATEYRRTRKGFEDELHIAEEALAKVQAKIAALDLVWTEHFSKGHCGEPVQSNGGDGSVGGDSKTLVVNGLAQILIDAAADRLTGNFGVKEVEAEIRSQHPDKVVNKTTIAGRLRKLVDEGRIELVEAGQGRRPGKFRGRTAA